MWNKFTKLIGLSLIFVFSVISLVFADDINLQPGQEITIDATHDIILLKSGDYEIIAIDEVGNESTPFGLPGVVVRNKLYVDLKDPNTGVDGTYNWDVPEGYSYNVTEGSYLIPQNNSITLNVPVPNNSDFKFLGWNIVAPRTIHDGKITDGSGNETFTMGTQDIWIRAIYGKAEYTIALHYPQEGVMKTTTMTAIHGVNTPLPNAVVLPIDTISFGWMHKPIVGDLANPPSYSTEQAWEELNDTYAQYADINNWHKVENTADTDRYYNKFSKINSDGTLDGVIDIWWKTQNQIIIKPEDFDNPDDTTIEEGNDSPASPDSDCEIHGKYKQKYIGTERVNIDYTLYIRRYEDYKDRLYVMSCAKNFYTTKINNSDDNGTPRVLGIYIDGRYDVVFKVGKNIIIDFSACDDRLGEISVYPDDPMHPYDPTNPSHIIDPTRGVYYQVRCEWYSDGIQSQIIPPLDCVRLGVEYELPKMLVLPMNTPNCYWTYNGEKLEPQSTLALDKYVKRNKDIITIKFYTNGEQLNAYINDPLNPLQINYNVRCNYTHNGSNKFFTMDNVIYGQSQNIPELKVIPLTFRITGWFKDETQINSTLDIDQFVRKMGETIDIYSKTEPIPEYKEITENQGNKYNEILPEEFDKIFFYVDYGNEGEEPIKYSLKDILDGKLSTNENTLKSIGIEAPSGKIWDNQWRISINKE